MNDPRERMIHEERERSQYERADPTENGLPHELLVLTVHTAVENERQRRNRWEYEANAVRHAPLHSEYFVII